MNLSPSTIVLAAAAWWWWQKQKQAAAGPKAPTLAPPGPVTTPYQFLPGRPGMLDGRVMPAGPFSVLTPFSGGNTPHDYMCGKGGCDPAPMLVPSSAVVPLVRATVGHW